MTILFAESDFWIKNLAFRERYARVIKEAYANAKKLLTFIPDELTFVNQVAPWECMDEYGQGAYTKNSGLILIAIDDRLPYGEDQLLEYTRQTVFHELNRAARFEKQLWHNTFLETCILEGLATAFERDYAPAQPPYGDYDTDKVNTWIDEIQAAGEHIDWYAYKFRHEDGERWIGYKVGTYLVDEAVKKSGKSILDLTSLQAQTIIDLAGVTGGQKKS